MRSSRPVLVLVLALTLATTATTATSRQRAFSNTSNVLDASDGHGRTPLADGLAASACGSCQKRQDIRTRSLENIKEQILFRLGMQEPLNTTGRRLPRVSQDMIAQLAGAGLELGLGITQGMLGDQPQHQQQQHFAPGPAETEEEDDLHIRTENVIAFAKPYPRLRHNWKGQGILYFQVSEAVSRHRVRQAWLHVWVRGSGSERPARQDLALELYKVVRDGARPDTPGAVRRARTLARQQTGHGHWARIDATAVVAEWFKSPKDNYGLIVNATATAPDGQSLLVTDSLSDGGTKIPFLDIATSESRRKRTKRMTSLNCNEDSAHDVCCRYQLTVDFEEFGWDFIIAPKRYEAYYCSGDCPYATLQKYAHTHLVTLTHPSTQGPCCAPKKMSPINMLYFDKDLTVIYGKLPGMVVDRCGCS